MVDEEEEKKEKPNPPPVDKKLLGTIVNSFEDKEKSKK